MVGRWWNLCVWRNNSLTLLKQVWCLEVCISKVFCYLYSVYRWEVLFVVKSICKYCFDVTHKFHSYPLNSSIDETFVSRNRGLSIPSIIDDAEGYCSYWCWIFCKLLSSIDTMLVEMVMVGLTILLLNLVG